MQFHFVPVSTGQTVNQIRPFVPVQLKVPGGWAEPLACLVSTGSDVTVFPEEVADDLGIDLSNITPEGALTDTGLLISYRPAPVRLLVGDQHGEECEWDTTVGFTHFPIVCPLLGHRWFLEYFETKWLGDVQQLHLTPNSRFPGTHRPATGNP